MDPELRYQWMVTIIVSFVCLGQGAAIGWLSPMMPMFFDAARSPLQSHSVITRQQAGWIGALLSFGAMGGTLIMGLLTQWLGTRRSLLLSATPLLVSWGLVYYSQFLWQLYLARICVGFTCGGVFVCNALYVAEIASDRIRGTLCSMLTVGFNTGILLGFISGTALAYRTMPPSMAVLPLVFMACFAFVPDTPQHLMRTQRQTQAEQSLRFYRNVPAICDKRQADAFWSEFKRMSAAVTQTARTHLVLADFVTREALRGLLIGTTLMAIVQFSGVFTLIQYAALVFHASHSTVDPNCAAMFLGLMQICGTGAAAVLIDDCGRKALLIVSTGSCTLLLAAVALFEYGHAGLTTPPASIGDWLPVVGLSLFVFAASLGIVPVAYVMLAEVLPPKIRPVGATLCTCASSVFSFVVLKWFPAMLDAVGLYGCLALFAAVAGLGWVFAALAVPETNGRCLEFEGVEGRANGVAVVNTPPRCDVSVIPTVMVPGVIVPNGMIPNIIASSDMLPNGSYTRKADSI